MLAVGMRLELVIDASCRKEVHESRATNKPMVLFEGARPKIEVEAVDGRDEAAMHLLEAAEAAMAGQRKAALRIYGSWASTRAPTPWRCSTGSTCSQ